MTGRRLTVFSRSLVSLTLALVACCTSAAVAQLDGFQNLADLKSGGATPAPDFTITLTPAAAKPGDEVTLAVNVKLPNGFYIYSTAGNFDGRTRIETMATGLDAIDTGFVADREPKTAFEPLIGEVSKFHDHVTWKKRYRMSQDADPAKVAITGKLTGQYCTDGNDVVGGKCVPINNPPYDFKVALADAADVLATRFEYEAHPKSDKKKQSLLRFKLSPQDARAGDKVTVSINIELDKGWHTYSMTKLEASAPTEIDLQALTGLKPIGASFRPDRDPAIEMPEPGITHEVFHDHVTWTREFEVLPSVKPGEYGVTGEIFFQMCKSTCVTHKVPFVLGAVLVSSDAPKAADVPSVKKEAAPKGPVKPAGAAKAPRPQDQGLFGFLLTAIGFGFLALLTPCVWPMVPITVSFFLKQSESEHHRPALTALVFCGSIVATFTILGVGIAALFGAAQLNVLANDPWLNVAIGTVFVIFAFNMLGLFEIRIPSSLLTFTANKEQAGGYLGAMFMALTFTLTSFTCTFAFAGSLLVAASQGQYYWPIIGMLAFGAAFASPFFVLALVPNLLKKLPKSGGWMNAVKVVMGLVEIGAAVKFFSVADFKWNPADPLLFDFVFVMITWLVLSLTIALYLLGVFRLAHDVAPAGISVLRMVLVMGFLGLSGNLAVALVTHKPGGGWIMEQIVAFAPPRFDTVVPKSDLPEPFVSTHGIRYALDVDKAIAYAMAAKQPMLFDFTGVNCLNCRKMELKMTKPHNRSRLDKFVLVQLYTDTVPGIGNPAEVERLLKRNRELQIDWFNDATLPAYAVVSPDGKTILSAFRDGLELQDGRFAAFMDEGLKKWSEMGSE